MDTVGNRWKSFSWNCVVARSRISPRGGRA
jgi:hypothetical protein